MSPHLLRPRRSRTWPLLALAVVALSLTAVTSVEGSAYAADAPAGWTTVFDDDFSGADGSGLDGSQWVYDTGHGYPGGAVNWGTGEVESMSDSTANVHQDGAGHLAITPIRDGSGNWTSGRVETQRTDFEPLAGGVLRIEASIEQPDVSGSAAQGYWPAFWMLGAPARGSGASGWPALGEIDILEDVNGQSSSAGTFHCGTSPGGPCNETTGLSSSLRPVAGGQSGFRTYALEWDRSVSPQQLRWYIDGTQTFSVSENQVDGATWASATGHGFFLILDVAIGGNWPGAPGAQTASGIPMLVDYVAVYSRGGGTGSAAATTPAASTPAASVQVTPTSDTPVAAPSTTSTASTSPAPYPPYGPVQRRRWTGQR